MDEGARALSDRIQILERRTRRQSALLFAAAVVSGVLVGTGAAVSKNATVKANQFVLEDDQGVKFGELVIGPEGGRLVLYGTDGRATAQLPMRTRAFPANRD